MNIPAKQIGSAINIPMIGLGLWKIKDQNDFNDAFKSAWEAGYRHFDTAQVYGNEHMLGHAWKAMGISREEIFITSKINIANFGHGRAKKSMQNTLENLQTEYVDLMLLHFPVTLLRKPSWQALEEIKAADQAKAIGVSNYTVKHLEEMTDYATIQPAVNQVELHVFLQQPELLDYCRSKGIAVEAYSPLAHGKVMDDPIVQKLATKYRKSYAQIMLKWCLQKDLIVLPKSVTPSRIQENIDLFDFEINESDMQELSSLDRDLRTCWSPVHVP